MQVFIFVSAVAGDGEKGIKHDVARLRGRRTWAAQS